MITFEQKLEISTIAENHVFDNLKKHTNLVIYPSYKKKSHIIDFICENNSLVDPELFCIEVKGYSYRANYPDIGVEIDDYNKYIKLSKKHNFKIWIYFVDPVEKTVYGNTLTELSKPIIVDAAKYGNIDYPKYETKFVYFPLVHMRIVGSVPDNIANQMIELQSVNPDYITKPGKLFEALQLKLDIFA